MRAWVLALLAARALAQPVSLANFSDQGVFFLYLNEERAGRITFHWTPDGRFDSTFVLTIGGATDTEVLSLVPDSQGRWITAQFQSGRGKTNLQRDGRKIAVKAPGK